MMREVKRHDGDWGMMWETPSLVLWWFYHFLLVRETVSWVSETILSET